MQCTTSYFEGTIAMIEPQGSWVGKWQRIGMLSIICMFYYFKKLIYKKCLFVQLNTSPACMQSRW